MGAPWWEVHDLVRWANGAEVPGTRQIGRHASARVLVQLAVHANREGDAWPSAQTLADEIHGLSRRDVRNALTVLEDAGLIKRNGRQGRSIVWRLAVDMAGMPAMSSRAGQAGIPATSGAGELAGKEAGELAGGWAGSPATKGREGKRTTARGRHGSSVPGAPGAYGGKSGETSFRDA